jgi:hypothetical protein
MLARELLDEMVNFSGTGLLSLYERNLVDFE